MGVPLVLIHFIDWIFHESIQLYPNDEKEPPHITTTSFLCCSVTLSGKKSWRSWFSAIFDSKVGPQTIAKLVFLGNRLTMV